MGKRYIVEEIGHDSDGCALFVGAGVIIILGTIFAVIRVILELAILMIQILWLEIFSFFKNSIQPHLPTIGWSILALLVILIIGTIVNSRIEYLKRLELDRRDFYRKSEIKKHTISDNARSRNYLNSIYDKTNQIQQKMKTHQAIQAEIAVTKQLPLFDEYPTIMECWNEHEKLWRDDNGRSYVHWVIERFYQYHLIYFDEHLVIVERNGVTLFSHMTERFTKIMEGHEEPVEFRDDYPVISLEELAALPILRKNNRV